MKGCNESVQRANMSALDAASRGDASELRVLHGQGGIAAITAAGADGQAPAPLAAKNGHAGFLQVPR